MGSSVTAAYLTVPVFAAAAVAVALVIAVVSTMLAPRRDPERGSTSREERSTGEEAMPSPSDSQWLSAVLGMVFAALLVLLYLWAAVLGSAPIFVLVEMALCVAAVGVGLLYAVRGGARR